MGKQRTPFPICLSCCLSAASKTFLLKPTKHLVTSCSEVVDKRAGGRAGGRGSERFTGTELHLGKIRKLWRWMAGRVAEQCECA